jgi:FkbM family methyltransferase
MRALQTWRPTWKTNAIAAILQTRDGALVDVGANVGQTLLDFICAGVSSRYVGFEPNLLCARHLLDLIAHNRLENCELIPAALGERTGVATFYSYGGDVDSGATTRRSLRPRLATEETNICVFRFDDLEQLTEEEIALVKIDVEGSELEVLRGMERTLRSKRPWLLCEVLHRDISADSDEYNRRIAELARFLAGVAYESLRVVEDASGRGIAALESVKKFPDVAWHRGSEVECDYLFVPAGAADDARRIVAK